jgi:hypothetical protein
MLLASASITIERLLAADVLSIFVTSRQCVYGKLEKQSLQPFWDGFRRLLACHLFSIAEVPVLLFHVIVADVEHQMLL